MNIINPETVIFLLLNKSDAYDFRQDTEFLPKGSSIVAVLAKDGGEVTCIDQGIRLNERFLSGGPLPRYAPFAAASYFAKLWSLGVYPANITHILNGGPYNPTSLGDAMAPELRTAFEELKQGIREIPGEFERTMR